MTKMLDILDSHQQSTLLHQEKHAHMEGLLQQSRVPAAEVVAITRYIPYTSG